MTSPARARAAVLTSAALLLSGCAGISTDDLAGGSASTGDTQVLASFYPLQYVAERVGGDLVEVTSLTPPGTEPHDVELSPRQVRSVSEADLVLYLSGFQSAVDEAVDARDPAQVLDAADVADLVAGGEPHADEAGHAEEDEAQADEAHADEAHADEAHADEAHAEDAEHAEEAHAEEEQAHGDVDPHFWLDPQRLAALAGPVADALSELDPDHAPRFADAAAALEAELADLDTEYASGLASCERRVVVTSHEAFGYLTRAYDLEQVGISGLDPEAEPSPARLREIGDVVRAEGVTTIFTETLVNPKVAETLAGDLGITTAVLDPVESLTDEASDYRGVMEQNLAALREGLACA